jgi:hypothetical protein
MARVSVLPCRSHTFSRIAPRDRLPGLHEIPQQFASICVSRNGAVARISMAPKSRRGRQTVGVGRRLPGPACRFVPAVPQQALTRASGGQLERLGQVVVGAGLEAAQHVVERPRGEHENRHMLPAARSSAAVSKPSCRSTRRG